MKLSHPLYMLRHGETVWNTDRRMQGTKDSALTDMGRRQARSVGRALKAELALAAGPTVFWRSPLGRVRETADIVGRELGIAPGEWRIDERLRELSYGEWEGQNWKEIEAHRPNALFDWKADPHGFCPPGGETHHELRRRSMEFLTEVSTMGVRCVVLGHGVSGAVVRGLHLGLDAQAMFILPKPQDAFFRLLEGREERIEAPLVEPAGGER
jgi:broad specificity phosphatase PhoE